MADRVSRGLNSIMQPRISPMMSSQMMHILMMSSLMMERPSIKRTVRNRKMTRKAFSG